MAKRKKPKKHLIDLYKSVAGIEAELSELSEYDVESLDLSAELAVLRAVFIKVARMVDCGDILQQQRYIGFWTKCKKIPQRQAESKWGALQHYEIIKDVNEFLSANLAKVDNAEQLLKVYKQIHDTAKTSRQAQQKESKRIDEGSFGDFAKTIALEVERRMRECGTKREDIEDFRKWFGSYGKEFLTRNLRDG